MVNSTFTNHKFENIKPQIDSKDNSFKDFEAMNIWKKFLNLLSDSIQESQVSTWFSVIKPKSFINNVLTIIVPSSDFYSIIEKRFNKQIHTIIDSGLLGDNGKLQYVIEENNMESEEQNNEIEFPPINNNIYLRGNSLPKPGIELNELDDFNPSLYPKYNFDNFVRGENNDLATATAYAIANNPGKMYNPFFVYGGVGIGKTHLIQAIGNEILKKFPEKKVYYTSTPDFTTQFTSSIAKDRIDMSSGSKGTKKLDAFYKSLDVLILDDIQNLAGKSGTQEFIYQIFNTLYNNKKHIILSADKPISQLKDIEERLISRFKWGLVADIQPPNWEMRVAIIQKKLEESGVINVNEEIIHYIATNVKDSIRTIEGVIVGMIAESALIYKGQINLEIAEKVVQRVVGYVRKTKTISIENIINVTGKYYNISDKSILSKRRTKEISFARQVAMFLAKEMTQLTLESIGLNFGGKDHATVLYAYNAIKSLIINDVSVKNQIEDIKQQIKEL